MIIKSAQVLLLIILGAAVVFSFTGRDKSVAEYEAALAQALPIKSIGETQYLVFFLPVHGLYEASTPEAAYAFIDNHVDDLIHRVGSAGGGKHRLAFAILVPPWIVDKAFPGRLPTVIEQAFSVARKHDVAVYFSLSTNYMWQTRPDLWNFYDPSGAGYDPSNIDNVEWIDWEKHPLLASDGKSYRYIDWGAPQRLPPHMCYNSKKIKTEVVRLSGIAGRPIAEELNKLKQEGKRDLFAGITVGDEPSLDNYAAISNDGPFHGMFELMEKDGAPLRQLGYNALSNKGFSRKNPPSDMAKELAIVNQDFIALWAKSLNESGVPKEALYTHIPAGADEVGSPVLAFTNAPIWVAFNDFSRPGWTTYPDGPLKDGFQVLYDALKAHGNPPWGGTEANPYGLGGTNVPPYEYLKWHFDHGAAVVVINIGADAALGSRLEKGAWGNETVAAYRKFLNAGDAPQP